MNCPKCGTMIEPGSMFCSTCGFQLSQGNTGNVQPQYGGPAPGPAQVGAPVQGGYGQPQGMQQPYGAQPMQGQGMMSGGQPQPMQGQGMMPGGQP